MTKIKYCRFGRRSVNVNVKNDDADDAVPLVDQNNNNHLERNNEGWKLSKTLPAFKQYFVNTTIFNLSIW